MKTEVLRLTILVSLAAMFLAGCQGFDAEKMFSAKGSERSDGVEIIPIASELALKDNSDLSSLAGQLDQELLLRSGAVQELRAAKARHKAAKLQRFPKILPTAGYSLDGGGTRVGIEVEQTALDFGASRAAIDVAELDIQEKRMNLWQDRNQTVFDGLLAFLEITRISNRLRVYKNLERELDDLKRLVVARSTGGVADRGESLRVVSAQQEVQRGIIEDQSTLNEARSQLTRLMAPDAKLPKASTLKEADSMCRRSFTQGSVPEVVLAEITHAKAQADLRTARSRRFPKVVVNAALNRVLPGVVNTKTAGINLDPSSLLGIGRKQTILAAEADLEGARLTLDRTRESTQAELRQYEIEFEGLKASKRTLESLIKSKDETVSLYREQIEAGAMELPEGISFLRERTDTQLLLLDVEADIVKNCLTVGLKRGALARIELDDV